MPLKMWRFVVILQFRQNTFFCRVFIMISLFRQIHLLLLDVMSVVAFYLCRPPLSSGMLSTNRNRGKSTNENPGQVAPQIHVCLLLLPGDAGCIVVCLQERGRKRLICRERFFNFLFTRSTLVSYPSLYVGKFQCSRRSWKIPWSRFQIKPILWIHLASPISICTPV